MKFLSKKTFVLTAIFFLTAFSCYEIVYAWGFWGHRKINRMAVFILPSEMIGFYKKHIDYITEHSIDPDKRRYAVKEEAPRHYIDIDMYGENPFDVLPRRWKDAVEKYGEDTLMAHGIVPWHIEKMLYRLTEAFKENNHNKILKLSADIGHYIADAHVPLHTTANYNGQLTNQHGIHGFWESRIPEIYGDEWDYFVGKAEYIKKPNDEIWKIIQRSNSAVDSVLSFERKLNSTFPSDKKYAFEQRGTATVKVYSEAYSKAYSEMLGGMVEKRMREAVHAVGSFWYTAWVNAGQPDLLNLQNKEIADSLKVGVKEEDMIIPVGTPIKGHSD